MEGNPTGTQEASQRSQRLQRPTPRPASPAPASPPRGSGGKKAERKKEEGSVGVGCSI